MKDEHENEQSKRSWLNLPNILIALVLLFLLVILVWNQNISEKILTTQDDELILATFTPAPTLEQEIIPSEFYSEPSNTSGILLGSVLLLVIVLGSALWKLKTIKK